jgi:phage tail sheath protein FI
VGSVINDPRTGSQIIQLTGISSTPGVLPAPNPLATPGMPPSPYLLALGDDGTVLNPNTPAFHTALNAAGLGSGGVHLLDTVPIFNLLCVPGETDQVTISSLQGYCHDHRAFYIVDCNQSDNFASLQNGPGNNITGENSINSAFYFPWVNAPDPLQQGRVTPFPPCGFVAGLYAATDATRGVWKAPAGIDASLTGESGLTTVLTDLQNGTLNIQAINCLRSFPVYGDVIWGARTLRGNDQVGSEWKYVPIRRLALYLESSLYDGTQWVVFEPNDERLWSQIRLNVGVFMQGLFLQGAFQGTTPQQAYFVKCDAENNPQSSIDLGIVNILVGFAPLYPAEFVVIQIQQMAGQLQA